MRGQVLRPSEAAFAEVRDILANLARKVEGITGDEVGAKAIEDAEAAALAAVWAEMPGTMRIAICDANAEVAAVVRIGGGAIKPNVHRIAIGDGTIPSTLWRAWCGWSFGTVSHRRVPEASCERCLRAFGRS